MHTAHGADPLELAKVTPDQQVQPADQPFGSLSLAMIWRNRVREASAVFVVMVQGYHRRLARRNPGGSASQPSKLRSLLRTARFSTALYCFGAGETPALPDDVAHDIGRAGVPPAQRCW
jgi:hypothetical protein